MTGSSLFTPIEHYHSDVAIDRLFCGDIIGLNKTDLVSEERANKTEDFLRSVKEDRTKFRDPPTPGSNSVPKS